MLHPRVCCVCHAFPQAVYTHLRMLCTHVCMYGSRAHVFMCACVYMCVHTCVTSGMPGLPCEVLGALTLGVRNGQGPVEGGAGGQ